MGIIKDFNSQDHYKSLKIDILSFIAFKLSVVMANFVSLIGGILNEIFTFMNCE